MTNVIKSLLIAIYILFLAFLSSTLLAYEDKYVINNIEQELKKVQNNAIKKLNFAFSKDDIAELQKSALSLLNNNNEEQKKDLLKSSYLQPYLETLSIMSLQMFFLNNAKDQNTILDSLKEKLKITIENNSDSFSKSSIPNVIMLPLTLNLQNIKKASFSFKCLKNITNSKYTFNQTNNYFNALLQILNSSHEIIEFNGAIWGYLPIDLPEDVKINLKWAQCPDLPLYKHITILFDRDRMIYSITNLPEADYIFVVMDKNNKSLIQRKVSVDNKCIFLNMRKFSKGRNNTSSKGKKEVF